jgi:hypothetical protein
MLFCMFWVRYELNLCNKAGNANGDINIESDEMERQLAIPLRCCGTRDRHQCLYGNFRSGAV